MYTQRGIFSNNPLNSKIFMSMIVYKQQTVFNFNSMGMGYDGIGLVN